MKKTSPLACFFVFLNVSCLLAQCDPSSGFDPSGHPCIFYSNARTSAAFLRIIPDARSGAMGDVTIALTPDANSISFNASKLAMADKKWGGSVNYTPWMTNWGDNLKMFLSHGAGYYQFGKKRKHAIGFSYDYFSLGAIQWEYFSLLQTDIIPIEKAFTGAYAIQLNKKWAFGLAAKYIHTSISTRSKNLNIWDFQNLSPNYAFAADISTTYKTSVTVLGKETNVVLGAALSNFGSRIAYRWARSSDFLPTNLGIGGSWNIKFNEDNRLLVALDLNKLLVVTPKLTDTVDANKNRIGDWKEISVAKSMLKSITDSPYGFKDISTSFGLEYWLKQHIVFRTGYHYQNEATGGRNFFTFGGGVRYKAVGLNVSYLKSARPTTDPLDKTWRFSLLLN